MIEGICNICGEHKELSKEHVPPQKAFNSQPIIRLTFEENLQLQPETGIPGRKVQGGVSFSSICEDCNNKAGGLYVRRYLDWWIEGRKMIERKLYSPNFICPHEIYPLLVLKEIVTMFF